MIIVKIEEIHKIYDKGKVQVKALAGVNLEIQQGEFIIIMGPSGSGKTTLLNLIGGIDKPTMGKIFLDKEDITKLDKSGVAKIRLKKIGFIFQAQNLIPTLTAIENIEFVMMLQGIKSFERREKVINIMKELGIEGIKNRFPNEMSGGQQQRVAIARAIVSNPVIVLADEPTANLDSSNGAMLIELMKKLNQEKGITFIISTHDQMVMNKASRVIKLHDGMIID